MLEIDWQYHPKQNEALDILELPEVEELCYGGAKGGGKSVVGCRWVFRTDCATIKAFDLKPSKYPIPVGFMGRKRATDFNKTTLETWKRQIPPSLYRINEQKKEIIICETVKEVFGGFDDRQDIEKFNSAEYGHFFVDQAEEITEDEIGMLRAALRLKINGKPLKYKGLLTANPAQCWLKREFVDKPHNKGPLRFLQALPSENPYLPETYFNRLDMAFKHRPELLRAYKFGDWTALEGARVIIKSEWLRRAKELRFFPATLRKLIVCDPARFGDDETVIYYMENTEVIEERIFGQAPLTKTAGECAELANRHKDGDNKPLIVVDADGLGAGVVDDLRSWGFKVYEIHSQGKATAPDRYYNVRAEMWWTAGIKYSNGDISEGKHDDPELDRQLTTVNYDFRNGKIIVEEKPEIKKKLTQSPDRADTRIMGLYVLPLVPAVEETPIDEYELQDAAKRYKPVSAFK